MYNKEPHGLESLQYMGLCCREMWLMSYGRGDDGDDGAWCMRNDPAQNTMCDKGYLGNYAETICHALVVSLQLDRRGSNSLLLRFYRFFIFLFYFWEIEILFNTPEQTTVCSRCYCRKYVRGQGCYFRKGYFWCWERRGGVGG